MIHRKGMILMNRETIKDFYGKIIGYIDTADNGNKTVRDFYGRVLGYYDKGANVTKDFYHRIIGRGDMAASLLYNRR